MPDRGDLPYIDLSGKFGIGCQDIDDTAQVMWPFPQLRGLIRILVKGRRPRMVRSGHNIALLGKLGRKPVQVAPAPSITMRENHQRMGAGVGGVLLLRQKYLEKRGSRQWLRHLPHLQWGTRTQHGATGQCLGPAWPLESRHSRQNKQAL